MTLKLNDVAWKSRDAQTSLSCQQLRINVTFHHRLQHPPPSQVSFLAETHLLSRDSVHLDTLGSDVTLMFLVPG